MLEKDFYIIDSKKDGPYVAVIGGLHGNETCGLNVIEYLKKTKLSKGKLILIKGNLEAIKKNIRQVDENLNRLFKKDLTEKQKQSYEYKRSIEITEYLKGVDTVLDLHSVSQEDTEPFVICSNQHKELVGLIPVHFSCSGFNEMEEGGLICLADRLGKIGISIECGQHKDDKSTDIGIESVERILSFLGMINSSTYPLEQKMKQKNLDAYLFYKTKTNKFEPVKRFKEFEEVKKGTRIALDGDEEIIVERDSFILFSKKSNKKNDEGFILLEEVK